MRPYLAIIKDSFHEAFASRVLWILLILITLGLCALAPLGFRSEQLTEFRQGDFLNARAVAREMLRQYEAGLSSPGLRICGQLPESARKMMAEFANEEAEGRSYFEQLRQVLDAWNELLKQPDLYRQQDWADVLLGNEARELLERDAAQLSSEELARLNRLLIQIPYEEHFRPQPPTQMVITYAGAGISPPIRISQRRLTQIIEQIVIPGLISFVVGVIAVLAAIVVTSPIIPQMFDPGSLSLLLSKPISRSLMFLSKFLGGCAFILINVTYLIAGLWIIAGLRFGIWNHRLLLCIPIFLFLFVIYYSVSAVSGVIWRNAIVCVVLTVLFWFVCWIVGVAKGVFEQLAVESQRIVRLVQAGETLIAVDEQGTTKRWNTQEREWEQVFVQGEQGPMGRLLGPVYDTSGNMLLAAPVGNHGLFRSSSTLLQGKESDGWRSVEGPALPEGTFELLPDPHGRLLAVTTSGIEELSGEMESKPALQVFFMEIPQSLGKPFRFAGPEPKLKLAAPTAASVRLPTGDVAIYSRGKLLVLNRRENDYVPGETVEVPAEDPEQGAAIAWGGDTIVLALGDGRLLTYDASTLQLINESRPDERSEPRWVVASQDGRWFATVLHNATLYLLDTAQGANASWQEAEVRGQGDISAVAFSADGTMLVADRAQRVSQYQPESLAFISSMAPPLTGLEIAYYYFLIPLHAVFPKPSELDETVQYVLKGKETTDLGMSGGDLQAKRAHWHPWRPIRSSLIFVLIVLTAACVYIQRQDF